MPGADVLTVRAPANRERIDRIIATVVSFFGFGFALQTVPPILGQLPDLRPAVAWPVLGLVFGALAASVLTAVLRRGTRVTAVLVAGGLLLALVSWPFSVLPDAAVQETPWIWYLMTIGTAFCTTVAPLRVAIAYAITTPLLFGVLRVLPPEARPSPPARSSTRSTSASSAS
ncbi:hypothetical protein Q0F99_01365 [Rathayibacter oskolensis]|uniref:hypothetical protein n=1 Tax=Rathayibacter oskolensis TaxID=1891671 RepID=UPI00265E3AE4|nr:hypothetical protein [Rathayibacter oskolensis]WKK71855.1 hypothetical protein Q0F99_01365 [Rathayibacter oskolensis]